MSDFIHLGDIGKLDVLSSAIMFLLFALTGLLLGFVSLFYIHQQLLKRISTRASHSIAGFVLLLCSFAIYLGRDLRWNSWDAILHPAAILFDVSDPFIHPAAHRDAFSTTLMFLVLLGSLYIAIWQLTKAIRTSSVVQKAG